MEAHLIHAYASVSPPEKAPDTSNIISVGREVLLCILV